MRRSRTTTGVGGLLCLSLAAPGVWAVAQGAAVAAGPAVTLRLELNEPAGSRVARDSSGRGHHGAIGSHVRMTGSYADWDRHPPDASSYYGLDHLIVVDDEADASLDPGTGNFSVEIRYRSTDAFGNIIQKGQARTVGGQVKFQQPKGVVGCMFKSPTGRAATNSKTPLNDGAWHVVRCDRTPTAVTMYVDGTFRSRTSNTTGLIDNRKPWTIGGKLDCDTSDPDTGAEDCDYFPGDIDYVLITKG